MPVEELERERVQWALDPQLPRLVRVEAAERKLHPAQVVAEILAAHYGVSSGTTGKRRRVSKD